MKVPENLVFLSCQPADPYFHWQIEVQIVNFRELGISSQMQVVVWYRDKPFREEPPHNLGPWKELSRKYPEVKFYYYVDQGVDLDLYIPQIRPHSLKKHFLQYPMLKKVPIFYHDADIIFRELPDFEQLCLGKINWVSDTSHYLDYSYLTVKEKQGKIPHETVVKELARLTSVDTEDIRRYDRVTKLHAGGAQYLFKGIDASFWEDVEKDCLSIRHYLFNIINKTYFPSENAGFQSWCADMWAVNFNLWKRGIQTRTAKELNFCWAAEKASKFFENKIYHNAGAAPRGVFSKTAWIERSPIGRIHNVSKNFASYHYVEAIKKVKK